MAESNQSQPAPCSCGSKLFWESTRANGWWKSLVDVNGEVVDTNLGNNILDSPSPVPENEDDRPEDESGDEDLERLVREIFNIIPSYYDEREADQIKRLIKEYLVRLGVKDRQRK